MNSDDIPNKFIVLAFSMLLIPMWTKSQETDVRLTRVALCFFGLTRSLNYTIDNLRSSIMDPLLMHDVEVDIYVHSYNATTVTNPRSSEQDAYMESNAWKMLRANVAEIEDPALVEETVVEPNLHEFLANGDPWEEDSTHLSLRNLIKSLHSQKQVTKMWTASDNKYDIVLYLRSDLWFYNLLSISELSAAQQHTDQLYTPDFHMWGGLNDRLAFGDPQVMSVYGNRLDMAKSYAKEHPLHSETFLKAAMQKADVGFSFSSIRFARVRATGEIWSIWYNESDMQISEPAMRPHLHVVKGHHGLAQLAP